MGSHRTKLGEEKIDHLKGLQQTTRRVRTVSRTQSDGGETPLMETIRENPHDLDEFVEFSTEQYDHKRGCCTVSAEFKTTIGNLKENIDAASGWDMTVSTNGGEFSTTI